MTENDNTVNPTPTKSSKTKTVVAVAIVGIIILFVVGLAIKFFAKNAGTALPQGAIENKTDLKTDLKDVEKGKFTITDTKTGQTVNVGGEELPGTFPKDFPVYPGAKVVSSVSGSQQEKVNGLLVIFTTPDGLDKVVPFYKSGLSTSGWAITSSFDSDTIQTWVVTKSVTEGSVSITSQKDQTTIQVALGDKE